LIHFYKRLIQLYCKMATAKSKLAEGMQKLFQDNNNGDARNNGDTDFVIKSEDGQSFNVHSWVLKLRRTDFLNAMLTSDFKERMEGAITIPAEEETVELFVKFLYGFELDENISLFTWKELVQICGVYDRSIHDAAAEIMMKHLKKWTVFDILDFCKQNGATKAVDVCRTFIAMNFDPEILIRDGHFDDHPETAVKILKINSKKDESDVKTEVLDPDVVVEGTDDGPGPSGSGQRSASPRPGPSRPRRMRRSPSPRAGPSRTRRRSHRSRSPPRRRYSSSDEGLYIGRGQGYVKDLFKWKEIKSRR